METLLLLIILLTPVVLIVGFTARARRRRRAEAQARASIDPKPAMDALFSGAPTVTYQVAPSSLAFETVVSGAVERGYRLEGQSGSTLVFARAAR